MSTNLGSAYALSAAAHPLLKASGDGVVLFNSSVAGGPTAMRCAGMIECCVLAACWLLGEGGAVAPMRSSVLCDV